MEKAISDVLDGDFRQNPPEINPSRPKLSLGKYQRIIRKIKEEIRGLKEEEEKKSKGGYYATSRNKKKKFGK